MAKTSGEIEKEFIQNLKANTGKNLASWLQIISSSGIDKRNDIVKWLKETQDFGHMNASLLTGIYLNGGKPVYASEEELLENQLKKYEVWRPLFNMLSAKILKEFPSARMIPKKTYVSFTAKREFAAINIKSKEIRLGMDLGDHPMAGNVEKAKLTGPMARISHMVVLREEKDLTDQVSTLLEKSYSRVNS